MAHVGADELAQFGNADKPILIGSVFAGVLALAAVAGLLTRRRFAFGAGLVVALVTVAGVAVATRPGFETLDIVPALLTAAAGVGSLWWMHRTAQGLPLDPRAAAASDDAAADTGPAGGAHRSSASRRTVLITSGIVAAAAVVMGSAGRFIGNVRARAEDLVLPSPAAGEAAPALPTGLETQFPEISPLQVSNADRGEHSLAVEVLSAGKPIQQSTSVTFTVQRVNTGSPALRPPPPPKPQPKPAN